MRICHIPSGAETNQQFQIMKKCIRKAGLDLSEDNSISDVLKCDIVHFNWYENIINGTPIQRRVAYLKKMVTLLGLKLLGKKIVLTLHNKMPHDRSKDTYSARILMWLIRRSDRIVVHCEKASKAYLMEIRPPIDMDKVRYVPLAHNIDTYPDTSIYQGYTKVADDIILMFIGMVRPYKNVEVIIDAANELKNHSNLKFLICGKCSSEEYRETLVSRIKTKNVICDFRFIPDEEIPSLMRLGDAVVLPYETESALNSGAAYLAFSYGKTVVSTDIGTLKDFPSGDVYAYTYSSDPEKHKENLKKAILKLLTDLQRNPASVQEKGDRLKEIIRARNSEDAITESLKHVYDFT